MERKSTYVFKKGVGETWRCIIDNSYGVELLELFEESHPGDVVKSKNVQVGCV
jgi:hypothetical protein